MDATPPTLVRLTPCPGQLTSLALRAWAWVCLSLAVFGATPGPTPSPEVTLRWPATAGVAFPLEMARAAGAPWTGPAGEPATAAGQSEIRFVLETLRPKTDPVRIPEINRVESSDRGTSLSMDGLALYFCSNPGGDIDLYVVRRPSTTSPWGEPEALDTINTAGDEAFPCLSADGRTLVFTSDRRGGQGGADLWMTTRPDPADPMGWQAPVNLVSPINTAYTDQCPHLSHDGLTLLFSSTRPNPNHAWGSDSLMMSRRASVTEPFGHPVPLGGALSGFYRARDPWLSPDGSTLYFISLGPKTNPAEWADVWVVPVEWISEPAALFRLQPGFRFPVALTGEFPIGNLNSRERGPTLSEDGRTTCGSPLDRTRPTPAVGAPR